MYIEISGEKKISNQMFFESGRDKKYLLIFLKYTFYHKRLKTLLSIKIISDDFNPSSLINLVISCF